METSLAQPEAWAALPLISVSVTLCKVPPRRLSGSLSKRKNNKKANDACLGKTEMALDMRTCYIHVPYITKQANVVCGW